MRTAHIRALAAAASVLLALLAGLVAATAQPAGLDPGRDCQTVRTCQFGRGGIYRGCISAYTCRSCRFVRAPCFVDGSRRVCQRLRCTWG